MVVTVVLRVRASPTDWGLSLGVVGNLPSLSAWGTDVSPLALHAAGDVFTRTLSLPAQTAVEYKYVLVDDGKIVRWEHLHQKTAAINRTLDTGADGDTIVVDDGIFGNDGQQVVNRVEGLKFRPGRRNEARPPARDPPKEQKDRAPLLETEEGPDTCFDPARETVALAEQLEAARTNVESVRAAVRSLRAVSPSSTVDEEAAYPPSTEREPVSSDAAVATRLVQRCLSDGAALVKTLQMALDAGRPRRTKRRGSQLDAHGLAVASVAAGVMLFVALVLVSPQMAREARRRVHVVGESVRGAVGEKGWREVLAMFLKKVKVGLGEAKVEVCEKAGWPKICGEKKVPKVIETEVVGVACGLWASLKDTVRAITGRRKPTAVDCAWIWVPRPVRRFVGALP